MAGGVVIDVKTTWRGTPGFQSRLEGVVEKLARDLASQWQANIVAVGSVDTGAYLNSVEAEPESRTEWIVHDGVAHGIYNEFGTHRMPARPAAQPALERIRAVVPGVFRQVFP